MHCQLCLQESPRHAPFCPVATGAPVRGGAIICAVCGGHNGTHVWAGAGSCPGARYETPQAGDIQALQAQITELRTRLDRLEVIMQLPLRK
jgi:hypothetical protein